jgi:copper transport protein
MAHDAATNYSAIVRTLGRTVLVDATPALTGINTVAVTVLDGANQPATVEQWSATATLPGSGLPTVAVPLAVVAPSVAAADAELPRAGKWTFTFTIRVAGAGPTTFTQVVPIADHS